MSSSATFLDPVVVPLIIGETVLDVGCGYGRWGGLIRSNFWEAGLATPPFVDGLDAFEPNVSLCVSSGNYRRVWLQQLPGPIDGRWDTVLASEIIEHMEQRDVPAVLDTLEGAAKKRVIITTPNAEYNRMWPTLPADKFRHRDHRFEWTRAEFQEWANRVANQEKYVVYFSPVGPEDETVGSPTQMAIFDREEKIV